MVIITIEYEKDRPEGGEKIAMPTGVQVTLERADDLATATLRAGERVQHKLRLEPSGLIKIALVGGSA